MLLTVPGPDDQIVPNSVYPSIRLGRWIGLFIRTSWCAKWNYVSEIDSWCLSAGRRVVHSRMANCGLIKAACGLSPRKMGMKMWVPDRRELFLFSVDPCISIVSECTSCGDMYIIEARIAVGFQAISPDFLFLLCRLNDGIRVLLKKGWNPCNGAVREESLYLLSVSGLSWCPDVDSCVGFKFCPFCLKWNRMEDTYCYVFIIISWKDICNFFLFISYVRCPLIHALYVPVWAWILSTVFPNGFSQIFTLALNLGATYFRKTWCLLNLLF